MSAPLKPHWKQPSHPAIQEVVVSSSSSDDNAADNNDFSTKSISRVALPPFALFAPLTSPPVTPASAATYATVQVGRHQHINLNSDLLYINHSCEPSLVFDTASRMIWVGPRGLQPGDELTFFYPSTEWDMAQSFDCLCGHATCRGRIGGARSMKPEQLAGLWLNAHIWELLQEKEQQEQQQTPAEEAKGEKVADATEETLVQILASTEATLQKADEAAEAARRALAAYRTHNKENGHGNSNGNGNGNGNGHANGHAGHTNGHAASTKIDSAENGAARHSTSSRELGGEMGGDTVRV